MTLRRLLKDTTAGGEAYQPAIEPLDITLKRVLIENTKYDIEAYKPSVKPLDITLIKGA